MYQCVVTSEEGTTFSCRRIQSFHHTFLFFPLHFDMRLFLLAFALQLIALVYGLKEPPKGLQIGKLIVQ